MTGDIGRRQPEERPADLWTLPEVVDLDIRHVDYAEPLRRYVTAREIADYSAAIEFHVTTDGELPIRAYPAVLFVGDVIVNDYEQVDRERYVFRAFDPEALPAGAPIALGWPRRPDKRRVTRFRYDPPSKPRGIAAGRA